MNFFLLLNPYSGSTFIEFFGVLLGRLWAFATGNLPSSALASDEVQLLVLTGVALSSALAGSFLVLRKMTMLANSLSHTILLGIVGAFLFTHSLLLADAHGHEDPINVSTMLIAAVVVGLLTTFITEFLHKVGKLQEDASTGLVFTSLFALGIVLVTVLTRNLHVGAEVVMGNVDALHVDDFRFVYIILAINLLLFTLFFREFTLTTFDAGLARSLGVSPALFNYLLMALISVTVIGAFRAVGVLMVLTFITGPALTARLLTHDLKWMVVGAMLLGTAASFIGVALSRHLFSVYDLTLSTGGIVVCVIGLFFLAAVAYRRYSNILPQSSQRTQRTQRR